MEEMQLLPQKTPADDVNSDNQHLDFQALEAAAEIVLYARPEIRHPSRLSGHKKRSAAPDKAPQELIFIQFL